MDKKTRVRRNQYVTNDDCDRISHILYNNLNTPLWEEHHIKGPKLNREVAEKVTIEGEVWVQSPLQGYDHVVLTSYGRAINTHRVAQLKPAVTSNNLIWYMGGTNLNSNVVFEEVGWEHHVPTMVSIYKANKWPMSIKNLVLKNLFKT